MVLGVKSRYLSQGFISCAQGVVALHHVSLPCLYTYWVYSILPTILEPMGRTCSTIAINDLNGK